MSARIAVIGAGWYGCHIATSLKALGFEVSVYERDHRVLNGASGNNQFRLHLGFHYARHHGTRVQSREGFGRFVERYPQLSRKVDDNIYAVPTEDSLLDFSTYKLIMTSSGIEFKEIDPASTPLMHISGAILTEERVLLIERAREYFTNTLGSALNLNATVDRVEQAPGHVSLCDSRFDYVIDATWGHMLEVPAKVYYEPTLLLYYETAENCPAVTLVDGPLCSLYPTEERRLFTLSSVPLTPLGRFENPEAAFQAQQAVTEQIVETKRGAMEAQMQHYMPSFGEIARYVGPQISMKTKPVGEHDDRMCRVYRNDRVFSILSGKIDTVFFALDRILAALEAGYASGGGEVKSALLGDIENSRRRLAAGASARGSLEDCD